MANRIKLTKAIIDAWDHADGQWLTDTEVPQLVLRCTATSKSYTARWWSRTGECKRQDTIAKVGEISIAEARDRVRQVVAQDRPRQVETLADVYEIWDQSYASLKGQDHTDEMRRSWARHIEPELGKTKLSKLKHADIQFWYNKKLQEHPLTPTGQKRAKPYSPNTVRRWISYISKLCAIARKHEYMIGNPCENLEMATPRKRLDIFTRDDLKTLGENFKGAENKYPVGVALLRFLMFFPCRGKEAREMEWTDLDLYAGTWTIPAERYKTDQDKVFPLGPLQLDHLRSLPRWSKRFVFPRPSALGLGSSRISAPDADLAVTKNHQIYVWKKVRPKKLGAHTLRKTIGHLLLNNDVPLEVVSKLMGHSTTLVTQQIYAHLDPQTAGKFLSVWTKFLEDEDPEPASFVDDVLAAHAVIKVTEYNTKLDEEQIRKALS